MGTRPLARRQPERTHYRRDRVVGGSGGCTPEWLICARREADARASPEPREPQIIGRERRGITSWWVGRPMTLGYSDVRQLPEVGGIWSRVRPPAESEPPASPTETAQVRDTVADPDRNPTDETAHSGTLVMRVKCTENSRSPAWMRVNWAVGAFSSKCSRGDRPLKSGRSYHRRRSRRVTTRPVSVRGCLA